MGNKLEETPYKVNISALHQGKTENQGPSANKEKSVGTASIRDIFMESLAKWFGHIASEHVVFAPSFLQAQPLFYLLHICNSVSGNIF